MPTTRVARGWRSHIPDYWLILGVTAALAASAALVFGVLPLP